ncbi:hypothetical protein EDB83DRAFT_2538727 [Lactarius deliciosus]|nr:hypothetical protein EDB83DRAFT_2538727 [Lactarius deliciosus]
MPGPQTSRILAIWSVSPTIVWSLSDGFDLGIPSPSPVPSPNHHSLTLLQNRFDPTRAALARVAARVPVPAQNPSSTPSPPPRLSRLVVRFDDRRTPSLFHTLRRCTASSTSGQANPARAAAIHKLMRAPDLAQTPSSTDMREAGLQNPSTQTRPSDDAMPWHAQCLALVEAELVLPWLGLAWLGSAKHSSTLSRLEPLKNSAVRPRRSSLFKFKVQTFDKLLSLAGLSLVRLSLFLSLPPVVPLACSSHLLHPLPALLSAHTGLLSVRCLRAVRAACVPTACCLCAIPPYSLSSLCALRVAPTFCALVVLSAPLPPPSASSPLLPSAPSRILAALSGSSLPSSASLLVSPLRLSAPFPPPLSALAAFSGSSPLPPAPSLPSSALLLPPLPLPPPLFSPLRPCLSLVAGPTPSSLMRAVSV